jgi:hypothetical protein
MKAVLAMALCLALSACGGGEESDSDTRIACAPVAEQAIASGIKPGAICKERYIMRAVCTKPAFNGQEMISGDVSGDGIYPCEAITRDEWVKL